MTNLESLLERVKAATVPNWQLDVDIEVALPLDRTIAHSHRPSTARGKVTCRYNSGSSGTYNAPHFTRSVDSALYLAERKLPGHQINLCCYGAFAEASTGARGVNAYHRGATPVLAIIAALLSALIAQGEPSHG